MPSNFYSTLKTEMLKSLVNENAIKFLLVALAALCVSGCVSAPQPKPIDSEALLAVRSIGIALPKRPSLFASVGVVETYSGPAVISGSITGFLNGYSQSKASGFDALVQRQLPGLDLGKELVEKLSQELRRQGYRVEIFTPQFREGVAGQPASSETILKAKPEGLSVDAVVILAPVAGYRAPGPLNAYTRRVMLDFSLIEVASKKTIIERGFIYHRHFSDDYSFNTYGTLTENLPMSIDGLRKALLDFVPQIVDCFKGRRE